MRKLLFAVVWVISFVMVLPATAIAQSARIAVSPARLDFKAQPGQLITGNISVKNESGSPVQLQVVTNDFLPKNDTGEPDLILDGRNEKYGISTWFAESSSSLALGGQEPEDYNLKLRVPSNAAARTYYGVIRFMPPSNGGTLTTSVGVLVFITVSDAKSNIALSDLHRDDEGVFRISVVNSGEGIFSETLTIKITDENGQEIMRQDQDDAGSVLPESVRDFSFTPKSSLPDGRLTATVTTAGNASPPYNFGQGAALDVEESDTSEYPIAHKRLSPVAVAALAVAVLLACFVIVQAARKHPLKKEPSVVEDDPNPDVTDIHRE